MSNISSSISPTPNIATVPTATTVVAPPGSNFAPVTLIPNSLATGDVVTNTNNLQAAVSVGGGVQVTVPGVYCINATIQIPSYTAIYLGEGVIIVRLNGGQACTVFANANPTTGNTHIAVFGRGVIYCNANSYAATYAANSTDCPFIQGLANLNPPGILDGGGSITGLNPSVNGLQFDNVDKLFVGGGLIVMQPQKYQLYGSMITNFIFDDLQFYGDDTVNPANGSTQGRDSIHVQGNSKHGLIRNIKGTTNDDFVVLNCRDVNAFVTPRSTGNISDIWIQNVKGKNQRRGGAGVRLYPNLDIGTVSGGSTTNGYDVAPTISSITQTSGVATVTTATAHNMEPGQFFYITGATPSGYNTGTAAAGSTPGVVLATPSPTTFTYEVNSSTTSPATVVGTLVRYYRMSGITVEDVDQITYQDAAVGFAVTGDGGAQFGICDNCKVDKVSGTITASANGTAYVQSSANRLHNIEINRVFTQVGAARPAMDLTLNSATLSGITTIRKPQAGVPYTPNSGTGQTWIFLSTYESVVIEDMWASVNNAGGGWNNAISISAANASGSLTLMRPRLFAPPGQTAALFNVTTAGSAGKIVVDGMTSILGDSSATIQVGSFTGTVTGLDLTVARSVFPAQAVTPIALYGTNMKLNLASNTFTSVSTGAVYGVTNTFTVVTDGLNTFTSTPLFNSGSTGTWLVTAPEVTQAPAFTASYTPDLKLGSIVTPGVLTAGITINNPSNVPPAGREVAFILTQDGTGGRAVSWGTNYIFPTAYSNTGNTANLSTRIAFLSDGTKLTAKGANNWA